MVYLGDGRGGVRETLNFGRADGQTYTLAIADMDNDNHPDILVGNTAQPNAVFFNQGDGKTFREVLFGDPSQRTYNLAVGDACYSAVHALHLSLHGKVEVDMVLAV